jgi:hypothetical protein
MTENYIGLSVKCNGQGSGRSLLEMDYPLITEENENIYQSIVFCATAENGGF